MAALDFPHWEATPLAARESMHSLAQLPSVRPFYLAGGTALALRLGHRLSLDLDLFANLDELGVDLRRSIRHEMLAFRPLETLQDSPLGLVLKAGEHAVSFFTYGYPLLEPTDAVEGLQVARLLDLGLMKLDAVAGRGERKDYYDLYFLCRHVPLEAFFERAGEKYPHTPGFQALVLSGLVDFDKADQQADPIMLVETSWESVKEFFQTETARLGRLWLGLSE